MPKRGRADLHMHTTASDGWPDPHQLVEHASSIALNVIAVTDHDTIEGALRAADHAGTRLEVVIGEEVSSRDGHIVAVFPTDIAPMDARVIDAIVKELAPAE